MRGQGRETISVPGIARPVELCGSDVGDTHVRGFIQAFVTRSARERWLDLLVKYRPEWSQFPRGARGAKLYDKVHALLDAYYPAADGASPSCPYTECGHSPRERVGVLIDPATPYCYITPSEAHDLFTARDSSMILSMEAGRRAIVFCHDGYIYTCSK
jgi:hypothetical protein